MPTSRKPWADRGSRQSRGYGAEWQRLRLRILQRDQYLCVPCYAKGRATPATQVDHVTPKAAGGTDEPANLQAICDECHRDKSLREAAEAQGRTYRPRRATGASIWDREPI